MKAAAAPTSPGPAAQEAARDARRFGKPREGWRRRWYVVIFESDTPAGYAFDVALIWAIVASIAVVILASVEPLAQRWGAWFQAAEWAFTLLFTAEYLARLTCVERPLRYARSFYGVIDLLSVAPTYLAVLVPGLHALIDVRVLRLLRIFRIFKLSRYASEMHFLASAIASSRRKILVFLGFVLMVVLVAGTLMYVVEGPEHGFTSIPTAMYWAITTMTTVGFGDITPRTDLGRLIASSMMLLGWGVLAVPTGIVTAEMSAQRRSSPDEIGPELTLRAPWQAGASRRCSSCDTVGHDVDARFCRRCGSALPDSSPDSPRTPT